ncbi:MAG: hypothetical protein RAP03_06735, partial [Candidatus Electryonea clarkiae]|nr:hypothetical protein [Candidatus Electryonea clarkiae]
MKSALLRTLAVSTLMLMLVSIVSARDENNRLWEPYNGVGIRSGYHIEWFRSLSWNDQGEMCVTWSDTRAGGRDIYGQVITPENGEVWGEGGLMLGNGLSRQEDPHIMATSDGGWILTWIDYRFDVAIEDIGDVWMQKLNSDGEPQWRYEEEPNSWGIPIARFQGKQIAVQTFDDGDGGGVAVWADARNGSADIYCQRVNSNGEAPQGWIERDADFAIDDTTYGTYQPGNLMVAGGPEAQGTLEGGYTADTDGAGGIIVGWKDARDPNNQNLYAQRISVDGERMWDVDPETPDSARAYRGLPICLWADEQDNLKLCPDGESGAFFIWKDPREDFNNDIYGQRVDAEGNILWTENGAEVVLADAVQTKLRIVNSAPGEAIILWEDQREDFYTSDLRMQKLSGDDGLVLNWGEVGQENDGLILCDADQNQFEARISADGNGGALISWTDERFSEFPDEDLYAQYIDSDGEKYWGDENGLLICDAELQQTGNIGRILNDDVYTLVWQDFRKGSPGL